MGGLLASVSAPGCRGPAHEHSQHDSEHHPRMALPDCDPDHCDNPGGARGQRLVTSHDSESYSVTTKSRVSGGQLEGCVARPGIAVAYYVPAAADKAT